MSQKKQANSTKGLSMKWRLIGMVTIPLSVVCIFLTYYSFVTVQYRANQEALNGIKQSAVAINACLSAMNDEKFYLDEDNNLWKGDYNITTDKEFMDALTKDTTTEVTIFYGDTCVATTMKDVDFTKVSSEISKTVLDGQPYSALNADVNGEKYYAYYEPLENPDGTIAGMVFVGRPSADVAVHVQRSCIAEVFFALICIILTNLLCTFIIKKIITSILAASNAVENLSKGDLSADVNPIVLKRNDEIGAIGNSIETLSKELRSIIGNLKESSQKVLTSGNELENMANQSSQASSDICLAVNEISQGALSQAQDVENATQQISEIGNLIEQIVNSINQLNENALIMYDEGNEAAKIMQELNDSNQLTVEAIERIGKNVTATNHSVTQITEAVDLITNIASQTDLLSLNASIEAARAGEAGKGFSVVATEIQHLSQESGNSAQKITEIVGRLSEDSQNAMLVMEEVADRLKEQQVKLNETIEKFQNVRNGISSSKEHTKQIHTQAKQCDSGRKAILDTVQNLSAISEENAASTQETTASMEEFNSTISLLADAANNLKELAVSLNDSTKFFHL